MATEEAALVARCLAGDDRAIREFIERFQSLVFGVCLRMLGDRHDAEDAAQEVFLRALRGLAGYDADRPLRPWILTIAANRCRTHLGRRRRRPVVADLDDQVPDHRAHDADAAELVAELRTAVDRLRPEYKQVFLIFHEQAVSYQEMSVLIGKPVGTLKTWLHRARAEVLAHLRGKGLAEEWSEGAAGREPSAKELAAKALEAEHDRG
ncbi:MAG: RNA polymerase sigma factor [Planctomycetia bacterium]